MRWALLCARRPAARVTNVNAEAAGKLASANPTHQGGPLTENAAVRGAVSGSPTMITRVSNIGSRRMPPYVVAAATPHHSMGPIQAPCLKFLATTREGAAR